MEHINHKYKDMSNQYEVRYTSAPKHVKAYDTEMLRDEFLIQT